jgi:hypothetical protein
LLYIACFSDYLDSQDPAIDNGLGSLVLILYSFYTVFFLVLRFLIFLFKARKDKQLINEIGSSHTAITIITVIFSTYLISVIYYHFNNPLAKYLPGKNGEPPIGLGQIKKAEMLIPSTDFFKLMGNIDSFADKNWSISDLTIQPCFSNIVSHRFFHRDSKACVLFFYEWGDPIKEFMSVEFVEMIYDAYLKKRMLKLHFTFVTTRNGKDCKLCKELELSNEFGYKLQPLQ